MESVWIPGEIEFDVIPAGGGSSTPDDAFRVTGRHAMVADRTEVSNIFGWIRRITVGKSSKWHLLWTETEPDVSYGCVSFIFSDEEHREAESLTGAWLGRSSWIDKDYHPTAGAIVLHRDYNASADQLNKLVGEFESICKLTPHQQCARLLKTAIDDES